MIACCSFCSQPVTALAAIIVDHHGEIAGAVCRGCIYPPDIMERLASLAARRGHLRRPHLHPAGRA